jgi:2-isopropylmalate synthase
MFAAALMVRRDKFPYTNNIVLSQLYPTSQMLAECIAFGCSPNKEGTVRGVCRSI